MLCECAARRKLDFSALRRDSVSILVASARSRALQGALSGVPGRPWRLSGRSGRPPRRSGDALRMLLQATGSPERVPGAILNRFWVPRCVSGDRSSIDFRSVFRLILRLHIPQSLQRSTLSDDARLLIATPMQKTRIMLAISGCCALL